MGWTWSNVKGTWKNGRYQVDRKAECDALLIREGHEKEGHWYPKREVLKSAMVGSTYYAAVRTTQKNGDSEIWAAVFLTKTDGQDYFNFGYKDMDETCGPAQCQCPKGILKLLTETDSAYAKNWRKRCEEYHADRKEKSRLSKLPVGSRIEFINQRYLQDGTMPGEKVTLTKVERSQWGKKKTYWSDGVYHWPGTLIPEEYQIVA